MFLKIEFSDSSTLKNLPDHQSHGEKLIVLGFNDTLTLMSHFVWSPREREKREDIVEEMKERDREERGTGMKVKKQKK